jgi:hypothetical protein
MCDLTDLNEPDVPPVNGSVNPSAKTQYMKNQSGNPSGKKKNKSAESLKDIVMEAAAAAIKATSPDGHAKTMTQAEALLWSLFSKAIKGDLGAIKQILNWAMEYMPPAQVPTQKDSGGVLLPFELEQKIAEDLKAGGYLPASCPNKIEDIGEKILQKAIWLRRKSDA